MSEAKVQEIYAVYHGESETYLGDPAWFFEHVGDAQRNAQGQGSWGGVSPIRLRHVVWAGGKPYLLDERHNQPIELNVGPQDILAKKQAALAKLTAEERELLGL